MIRFVQHNDINAQKWDNAISTAKFPTIMATYGILDLLTEGSTWHALIMDDYQSVMPLPVRQKWGINYVFSPFFVSQLGIFSAEPVTSDLTKAFFDAIPKKYRQIDLLLNISNDTLLIEEHTSPLVSHEMSLCDTYENIHAHFAQNIRRNIKSAEKKQLVFAHDAKILDDVINLFKNNRGRNKAVHYHENDYHTLPIIANKLLELNRLDICGVWSASQNELLAGAFFIKDYNRIWFWFSGRNEKAAADKPMFFLLDRYLHENTQSPYLFDFNGSSNENVARMYKGFGGNPYLVKMIQYGRPWFGKPLFRLYQKIKH